MLQPWRADFQQSEAKLHQEDKYYRGKLPDQVNPLLQNRCSYVDLLFKKKKLDVFRFRHNGNNV